MSDIVALRKELSAALDRAVAAETRVAQLTKELGRALDGCVSHEKRAHEQEQRANAAEARADGAVAALRYAYRWHADPESAVAGALRYAESLTPAPTPRAPKCPKGHTAEDHERMGWTCNTPTPPAPKENAS